MNTMHEAVDFMTNITQLHVTTLFSQFEQDAQLYGNKNMSSISTNLPLVYATTPASPLMELCAPM